MKKVLVLLIACSFIASCNKLIDVDPPANLTTGNNVYLSEQTSAAVITGVYTGLQQLLSSFSSYNSIVMGLTADELKNYSSATSFTLLKRANDNNLVAADNVPFWYELYNYLYVLNDAIPGITNSSSINSGLKNQLLGEAKFLRAFVYFYLTNIFGDVPLVLTTDYNLNASLPKTPKADVYRKIAEDLNDAIKLLPESYMTPKNVPTTTRVRPNKWAAVSLLARVNLYLSNWSEAERLSNDVISQKATYDTVGLDNTFKMNNKEAIWQLPPVNQSYNTYDGDFLILTTSPDQNTHPLALTEGLYNSFLPGDNRRTKWIGKTSTGYYYPYKYKLPFGNALSEYTTVIRLSEMYLIRSEARLQGGNVSGATDDLNVIRKKAGLVVIGAVLSQNALLDSIVMERRHELFTEWGHRWYDMKRLNIIDSIMSVNKPGNWATTDKLFPIPQMEILRNSNIKQNDGYQ